MIIEIFAAASIGAIVGFGTCAALTVGKVADGADRYLDGWFACYEYGDAQRDELSIAHKRCAYALNTAQSRIERALDCVTENSAHVGKRMAKILRGEG